MGARLLHLWMNHETHEPHEQERQERSVEKADEPEGDTVGVADCEVVKGEEEVALRRIDEDISGGGKLGEEEGFAESSGVGVRDEGVHEVGVDAVDFFGTGEVFDRGRAESQEREERKWGEG